MKIPVIQNQIRKQSFGRLQRSIGAALIISMLFVLGIPRINAAGNHLDYSFSSNGSLLTDFGSILNPVDDVALAVALAAGKIIVAGHSADNFAVARYNADGTLDTSFSGDGKVTTNVSPFDEARAVVVQPDEKIVIAGYTGGDFAVLRYNANGSLDDTFSGDGIVLIDFFGFSDIAEGLALQSDGKLVVVGLINTTSTGDNKNFGIARLNANGSLDTTFDGNGILGTDFNGGNDLARDVLIQPDGKIVVAGHAQGTSVTGTDFGIARYHPNGTLDTTFHSDGKAMVHVGDGFSNDRLAGVARASDGKYILAGGMDSGSTTTEKTAIVRLTTGGLLDFTFSGDGKAINDLNPEKNDYATDVVLQDDGKIVASYNANSISIAGDFGLVRYQSDGTLDPTFGTGGKLETLIARGEKFTGGLAYDSNLFTADKIIAVGSHRTADEFDYDFAVARYRLNYSAATADFTGDGLADYGVFRPSDGGNWILNSATGGYTAAQFGTTGDIPVPGDYDRDGKADIAIFRPSTGVWYVLRSSNNSYFAVPFGLSTDKPTQGDYDGDGFTDPAVFRPSSGVWYAQNSTGSISSAQFGTAEDKPAQADFDGDGLTDLAVFRPSNGVWYIQRSALGFKSTQFGITEDRPVAADYDADGKADIGVWRPSTGVWYAINSQSNSTSVAQFGTSGDIPAPADFDGDGKTDNTVFRPANGVWYVRKSTGGFNIVGFGANGDIPMSSAYSPQ